jgi:acetyl esterase/lipase
MNPISVPFVLPTLPAPTDVWLLPRVGGKDTQEAWERTMVQGVAQPTLGYYPAPTALANGTAVIICPGGGYTWLSMGHEGTDVARWLNSLGVTAFILKSRLRDYGHPAPLRDVCAALRRVRARASSLGLRPDRLGILGFSAGGHLAASACTLHTLPAAAETDSAFAAVSARPDFAVLLYPVISMTTPHGHLDSRTALLGPEPDPAVASLMELHGQVTAATPPTCLIHAQDDSAVPVENALLYFSALRATGVPAALHVHPRGGHGFGLRTPATLPIHDWPNAVAAWMRDGGWLPASNP